MVCKYDMFVTLHCFSGMGKARSNVHGTVAQRRHAAAYLPDQCEDGNLEALHEEALNQPGGTSDGELIARFIQQCRNGASNCGNKTRQIKEALTKNTHYRVLNVVQVETRYGDRQVWTLGEVEGEGVYKVYGSAGLTSYTKNAEGGLDDHKVELMKKIHIEYCGVEGMLGGVPSRYLFNYHLPKQ